MLNTSADISDALERVRVKEPLFYLVGVGLLSCALSAILVIAGLVFQADGLAVFWPAIGLLTGFALIYRGAALRASLSFAALGMVLAHLTFGHGLAVALVLVAGNLIEAAILAGSIRRWFGPTLQFSGAVGALRFVALALVTVAVINIPFAATLQIIGFSDLDFSKLWSVLFSTHFTGVLVVTPLVVLADAFLPDVSAFRLSRWPTAWNWTIRQRLVFLVFTLATPLNLVLIGAIWSLANSSAADQRASLMYASRSIASSIEAALAGYVALGEGLARSPAIQNDDLSHFREEAVRLFPNPSEAWVVVSDVAGHQILNTRAPEGVQLPLRVSAGLENQRHAFQTRKPTISTVFEGAYFKSWNVAVDVPLFKDGMPWRSLIVVVDASSFGKLLNAQTLPKGWIAGVVDQSGRFITRYPNHDNTVGKLASIGWQAVMHQEGISEFRSREGELLTNANVILPMSGWKTGVGAKKSEFEEPIWKTVRWAGLLGAGISALCLALASWIAQRIVTPVRELEKKAVALVGGAPARFESALPEARSLWDSLVASINERRAAEAALVESSTRLKLALSAVEMGVWDWTLATGEVVWSPEVYKIFRYPDFDGTTESFEKLVFPEDRLQAERKLAIALKMRQTYKNDFRVRLPDGSVRWVLNLARAEYDSAGKPTRVLGIVLDITDRKADEERIELLLREVNHRSKNLLTVVQAIAQHTGKSTEPAAFSEALQKRLQSLSQNQDLLIDSSWHGVDLKTLVETQLRPFASLIGSRIVSKGPAARLKPRAAQALGMAFHELATNAAKYGALSNEAGKISIEWEVDRGADTFCLRWVEDAVREVCAPCRRGFGHTVLVAVVEGDLEGDVTLDYRESGLFWEVRAKASAVLEET